MTTINRSIITSLLDTDLYKISMGQAVFRLFPDAWVEYKFINRGKTKWGPHFVERLKDQILAYCELKFAKEEIQFLRMRCPYLSRLYLEWLQNYQPDPGEVKIVGEGGNFVELRIVGPWYRTIFWEVPLMAMISEQHYLSQGVEHARFDDDFDIAKAKAMGKLAPYSDFGTRRRYSRQNHHRIVGIHKEHGGENFQGTSNVWMAKEYDLMPIGTMAHEWIMFHGAVYGYAHANAVALNNWYSIYNHNLSIALTDTYTTKRFFQEFTDGMAWKFDGLRHDSGEPEYFADLAIQFYRGTGVDPTTKKIVFSDGLNVGRAHEIHSYCGGRIQDSYGIGTNFTNDVGVDPLNIVIKLSQVSDGGGFMFPAVKLSDVAGKHTGSKEAVQACKVQLGLE